jgi:hypothetical protein
VPLLTLQCETTVGTALNRSMAVPNAKCVLASASMAQNVPTAAACAFLMQGPDLFSTLNLLAGTEAVAKNDHHRLHLTIGTRGSTQPAGVELCALDTYSHLVEGEKLWFLAPPESEADFRALFDGRAPLDFSPADFDAHHRLSVTAVHQRAGDALYIPGGWVSVAQSLTLTVSFGSVYLRPWKLGRALDFAESANQHGLEEQINLRGIVENAEDARWGLSEEERKQVGERWEEVLDSWEAIDEEHC